MRCHRVERRRQRRRGAAMVLVLIFTVAALTLVTTGLAMTDRHAKMRGEVERHETLQAVLKAGIAAAINEINRDELDGVPGNFDPGRDGVGAITGWDGSSDPARTPPPGVPLTVTIDGATRTLGYYRTTIDKTRSPGKDILVVVAAWPSFDAPPGQLLLAAAELEVKATIETIAVQGGDAPVNPINLAGNPGGALGISVDGSSSVQVSGIDLAGASNVPAANIEEQGMVDPFARNFADPADPFVGTDTADPQSTTSNPLQTITATAPQAMSVENLKGVYSRFAADVVSAIPTATPLKPSVKDGRTLTLNRGVDQVYYAESLTVEKDAVLEGEGTLIISQQLHLKGELHWKGDVIVTGYEASTAAITSTAQLHMNDSVTPAVLDVTGNVIMLSEKLNQFHLNNDSTATIDGALLLLSDADASQAQLHLNNGTNLTVSGVTAVMADVTQYHQNNATSMTTNSLNFAFRNADPQQNKLSFKLNSDNVLALSHHSVETAEALRGLGIQGATEEGELQTISIKTVSARTWWERGVVPVKTTQDAQLANDLDRSWGY